MPEVELYHYKARAYDPRTGRFLQTDPTGYDDGLNWYAYVGNDPLNRSDPTGNQAYTAAQNDLADLKYLQGYKSMESSPGSLREVLADPADYVLGRLQSSEMVFDQVGGWGRPAPSRLPLQCFKGQELRKRLPMLRWLPERMVERALSLSLVREGLLAPAVMLLRRIPKSRGL